MFNVEVVEFWAEILNDAMQLSEFQCFDFSQNPSIFNSNCAMHRAPSESKKYKYQK